MIEEQNLIEGVARAKRVNPAGGTESGVLPWSWKGWTQVFVNDDTSLFLEGFAAVEGAECATKPARDPESVAAQIVALYKSKGDAFINYLRGSFAVALWDVSERKLILGTDHFGTRSIYYVESGGRFGFAPRIGWIASAPERSYDIDFNSLYFYLNHSFIPAPFTIYQSVRRLEPGHLLIRANGQVSAKRYWDMAYDEDQSLSEATAAANLRASLMDSVRFAFQSSAVERDEIGAFLSGGTDSSTIVGMLSQLGCSPVKSFSVGFDESAYNEIYYARVAAKHFKSQPYEYFVHPEEALEVLPTLAAAYDEPFGNSSAIPTFFCLKMARQNGVKIMFAGDGGDELFGGNERYLTEKIFTLYHKVPGSMRRLTDFGASLLPAVYPLRKIKNYVQKSNQHAAERFFSYQLYFRDHADEYLSDEFIAMISPEFPLEVPKLHYDRAGNIEALNRLLYVDLKLAVADNDLFKVNRMAETHDIQVRYPFLDPKVGEVSGKIPARLKVKGWSKRYIFKKAFEKFLPEEILRKKKHGFGLPTGDWLRQHAGFRDLARSLLLDPHAVQRGYFKRPALERLLALHDKERSSYYGSHIWNLMMLELWHRNHGERSSPRRLTSR